MAFRFGVLGPVAIWRGEEALPVGAPQQQALLAALVLRSGQQVSVENLCTAIWGEDDRGEALKRSVRTYVFRLRTIMDPDRTGDCPLVTEGDGYALRADPGASDLGLFDGLVARARAAAAAGDHRPAFDDLSAALELWRGEPLAGVPGPQLAVFRDSLAARRLDAVAARLEAVLALGRARDVAVELPELVAAHPLREDLHRLSMLALSRSGRQAEALELFERLRRRLDEELGVLPGPELVDLHLRILRGEPGLPAAAGPSATTVVSDGSSRLPASASVSASLTSPDHPAPKATCLRPAQLPAAPPHFTGRQARVEQLMAALTTAAGHHRPPVATVTGVGGVGKTALVMHVAHRLAERYPDGQLYVDLRGAGAEPTAPAEVLTAFLTALGVPEGEIPESLDERSALFRSVMAERRVLLVLDNAASAAQLRPLIPGTAGCAVLATGRAALWGLGAGTAVDLDVLTPDEALALFTAIAGPGRVGNLDHAAALDVVAACGHLPLAVQIAAARLSARPGWTVADLAGHLADAGRRLGRLQAGDLAVRGSFELSHAQLDDDLASAFRLLAGPEVPTLTVPLAAAVLETDDETAEATAERLVDLGLLETPEPSRYRFHDLVRLFAREKTEAEAACGVVDRMLAYFYAAAAGADPGDLEYLPAAGLPTPEPVAGPGPEFPVNAELPSLFSALGQVAIAGPAGVAAAGALLLLLDTYWVDRAVYASMTAAAATATMERAEQLGD
ncbi:MAG: AAA family ATPase, partial [Catenulispora sp.]|nr:AAA family ATPase [Catenulispora sp.]